jgi:hypothetical protein
LQGSGFRRYPSEPITSTPSYLEVCQGSEFRVQGYQGTGCRVQGSRFRVIRVQGAGFRVQGSGFRVQGSVLSIWRLEFEPIRSPPSYLA